MRALLFLLAASAFAQNITVVTGKHRTTSALAVVNTAVNHDVSGGYLGTISTSATTHTTGNLIVAGCRAYISSPAVTAVTDTAGNTYTALTAHYDSTGMWQWHYAKNITGHASNVVNCNISGGPGSSNYTAIIVYQVSGASTSSPLDASADVGNHATSTTYTSPTFSTANANSIIFFGSTVNALSITWTAGLIGGVTATGPLLSGSPDPIAAAEYRIVNATQSSITAALGISSSNEGSYGVAVFH